MKNKKFIYIIILCLTAVSFFSPIAFCYAQNYVVGAKSAIVINANSGDILFSQNVDNKLPMASTTKVATLITVLENCDDLNKKVIVASEAVGVEGTSMYLRYDEEVTVYELMLGAMLNSGNDACVALAYAVGGNETDFAVMMNNLANKVGATNTNFVNSHGLDDKNHYTTASDLAKIFAYGLKYNTFKKIINIKTATIEPTNKFEKRYLTNKNKLIGTMQGYAGGKIGFTDNAGRCLVSYYEKEGIELVCVVLNCYDMFGVSKQLLESTEKSLIELKNEFEKIENYPIG